MKLKPLLALAWVALPLLAAAQSAAVWRCGADGSSYRDTPCPAGQQLALAAARPAADVQDAQSRAHDGRQQADRLLNERLQREAAAQRMVSKLAPAAAIKPAAKPHPQPHRRAARPADDGIWRAVAPASRRAKG